MLQQTTVAAVIPYFKAFTERWPTTHDLAAVDLDDVLHAWQGLGYYARARNLHRCARVVVDERKGRFPDTVAGLRELPGIGPYTSAAIAAIAFQRPAAAVDGNVVRVLSRFARLDTRAEIESLAKTLVPSGRPGDFAQAMMDLGATVCRPKAPDCPACPWQADCQAHAADRVGAYPVKAPKTEKPTRHGVAFWLRRADGAVWLRKRPETGLLGGMTEVPSTDWREPPWTAAEARAAAPIKAPWRALPGTVRHTFTHFHLVLDVWAADTDLPPNEGAWSPPGGLGNYALPTVMKKIARHAIEQEGRQGELE